MIGLWVILLIAVALTSCRPADTLTDETPTVSPTETRAPTQTATVLPTFTPTATEPPRIEINAEDLYGSVVRFAHPWIGEPAATLETIAEAFSASNPWNIRVEVNAYGGDTALIRALQADLESTGQLPGLVAAHPFLLSALEGDFALVDLHQYINDPDWGFDADAQADFIPVFLAPFSQQQRPTSNGTTITNDAIMALPVAPQVTVLFYNTTWGEELGHSMPPGDLNAFRRQACDAAIVNNQDGNITTNGTGGWKINMDPTVLASWYYAFGGVIPDDGIPSFNNQAGLDAFGYLWDVKILGCSWFARQPEPYTYFADRLALVFAGQLDQVPTLTNWMESLGSEDEWVVIGFPGVDGEIILVDGPGLMVVNDQPENNLAAWLFAKHLLEPAVQAQLVKSLYTLPVRESAFELLGDWMDEYPQWAQGVNLLDTAKALPVSPGWGIGQWVLQDAVFQLLQRDTNQVAIFMELVDEMLMDLISSSP